MFDGARMTREYNIELNKIYQITTGGFRIYYPVKVTELGLLGIKIVSTVDNKVRNIPYRMIKRVYDFSTGKDVYNNSLHRRVIGSFRD